MVLVAVGLAIGLLPLADDVSLQPQDNRELITHVTEFTVLVSLMGVGLAIERMLDLRSWRSWRTWSPVWRMLLVAMPLTILGTLLLGWWVAGLAPAVALLLGAVLAPTDPVLASDVQVGEPLTEDVEPRPGGRRTRRGRGRRHPVLPHRGGRPQRRPGLPVRAPGAPADRRRLRRSPTPAPGSAGTSSARSRSASRSGSPSAGCWAARPSTPATRSSGWPTHGEPLLALAALLTSYGAAELVGGYGFLAVFACAMRAACLASVGTPTSARCTASSSGSNG